MEIKFKDEINMKVSGLLDELRKLGIDVGDSVYIEHVQDSSMRSVGSYLPTILSHFEGTIKFVIPNELIEVFQND